MIRGGHTGRFAATLALIFAVAGGFLLTAFYVILTRPFPPTYAGTYFALRDLSGYLVPVLAFSLLAYVLLVGGAIAVLCVYAFHRVVGPLYRMERALENIESGDPVRAVFLRDGDRLTEVSGAYNGFIEHLRESRREWIAAMDHADRLCFVDSATCRDARREALRRLSELLSRYR